MDILRFLPPVLFSFLFPGVGQISNGHIKKGLFIALSFFIALALNAWIWLGVEGAMQWPFFLSLVTAILLIWIYAQVDTVIGARSASEQKPWYRRWYACLAWLILGGILFNVAGDLIRRDYVEPYVSPSQSMLPSIWQGDRFYADKRTASLKIWRRGDLIVFPHPREGNIVSLKRVIAIAGDKVEKTKTGILVNGKELAGQPVPCPAGSLPADRPSTDCRVEGTYYVLAGSAEEPMKTLVVPPDSLFVMGDNRAMSEDSVHYGPIPISSAIGRPLRIWYSSVWNRMGLPLK